MTGRVFGFRTTFFAAAVSCLTLSAEALAAPADVSPQASDVVVSRGGVSVTLADVDAWVARVPSLRAN